MSAKPLSVSSNIFSPQLRGESPLVEHCVEISGLVQLLLEIKTAHGGYPIRLNVVDIQIPEHLDQNQSRYSSKSNFPSLSHPGVLTANTFQVWISYFSFHGGYNITWRLNRGKFTRSCLWILLLYRRSLQLEGSTMRRNFPILQPEGIRMTPSYGKLLKGTNFLC